MAGLAFPPLDPGATARIAADPARAAATEFESVFLTALLEPIFQTLAEESPFGGAGEETWSNLLVEHYAGGIAQAGGIGIADEVYRELLAMQETT